MKGGCWRRRRTEDLESVHRNPSSGDLEDFMGVLGLIFMTLKATRSRQLNFLIWEMDKRNDYLW